VTSAPAAPATLHAGFTVADLRRLAAFFRECLGCTVSEPHTPPAEVLELIVGVPGAEAEIAYVTAPGAIIELIQYRAPQSATQSAPRPCDVGFAHLAFLVSDVDSVVAAASRYGFAVPALIPTIQHGRNAGRRATYLRDANGFTVELMGG
jgi:catechol 2,3-dioxygenase-like lactoylglutathione lyase family enzyme